MPLTTKVGAANTEAGTAVGTLSDYNKVTLKKYVNEEEARLRVFDEQYNQLAADEELLRFGDGFEDKGNIKLINEKWTKDQTDLVNNLKARVSDLTQRIDTAIAG